MHRATGRLSCGGKEATSTFGVSQTWMEGKPGHSDCVHERDAEGWLPSQCQNFQSKHECERFFLLSSRGNIHGYPEPGNLTSAGSFLVAVLSVRAFTLPPRRQQAAWLSPPLTLLLFPSTQQSMTAKYRNAAVSRDNLCFVGVCLAHFRDAVPLASRNETGGKWRSLPLSYLGVGSPPHGGFKTPYFRLTTMCDTPAPNSRSTGSSVAFTCDAIRKSSAVRGVFPQGCTHPVI